MIYFNETPSVSIYQFIKAIRVLRRTRQIKVESKLDTCKIFLWA